MPRKAAAKGGETKTPTRTQKLHKHATLGIKEADKLRNRLMTMLKALPKKSPIHIPAGTKIATEYPQQSLQLVLKDYLEVMDDMSVGFKRLQTLFAGEKGFEAELAPKE